jgi:hypothetical protein
MWIVKGTLLALWLFGFGTMAWLYFALYRHLPRNSAVDIRLMAALTIQHPFWWTALVACFVLGLAGNKTERIWMNTFDTHSGAFSHYPWRAHSPCRQPRLRH